MASNDRKLNDYMHVIDTTSGDKEVIIVSAKDEETAKDYVENVRPKK